MEKKNYCDGCDRPVSKCICDKDRNIKETEGTHPYDEDDDKSDIHPTGSSDWRKDKKKETKEAMGASSAGAYNGNSAFGGERKGKEKVNNFEEKKIQADEATGASSSGSYTVPAFGTSPKGRKNPLKIDGPDSIYKNRAVKDKNWPKFGGPDGVYVKPKKKCEKFPYCNQGDIKALDFIHENHDELKQAISETSKKLGVPYNEVEKIVLKEIKQIFI